MVALEHVLLSPPELQSVLAVDNDDFQEEFGDDSEEGFLVLPRRPRDKPPREGGGRGRGNSTDADSVGLRQRTERAAENGASSSNEGEGGAEGVEPGRAAEKKVGLSSTRILWTLPQ